MKNKGELCVPKMRKNGLVVQALGDEVLVYDWDRHRAHCLSRTAAAVWEHCDGKRTLEEIAELMALEFETPVAQDVVRLGLHQLRKARLLEEPFTLSSPLAAMSRREAIRRVGLAAAVALPVVTSIIAPKAAQAANCRPLGDACNGNGNCCSQSCVGNICV